VWEATVAGRKLNFHLSGINNQNFIMRDEETGSWWQQVTGEAILGPLKGERLRPVFHDELTFSLWKREKPQGRVLRPDEQVERAGHYAPANWEERMASVPVTTSSPIDAALPPRALVIGIDTGGASKAYPFDAVVRQSPILDSVGGVPLFIVAGDDKKSVRAYERSVDGRKLEFFVKQDSAPLRLVDAETGSEWDFTGRATAGPLAGRQLQRIAVLNDYWFDWKAYHPETTLYQLGER
jgi:hypothetical protein